MRKLTIADVTNYLENINPYSSGLYKLNITKIFSLKKEGFISETLNKIIPVILNNLNNDIFFFKYAVYNGRIIQPFFEFYTKKDLKKLILLKDFDNYPYEIFGIRIEFIDTDSNRYIFIITIE